MKTFNSVIVKIKETHDDKVLIDGENGKVELIIPLDNTIGNIDDTAATNTNTRVRLYGEAVGDVSLIQEGMQPVYQFQPGYPEPVRHRNSQTVANYTSRLSDHQKYMYRGHRATKYDPSGYEPSFVYGNEQEIDIRTGDKVYFNYLGYDKDHFIKEVDGYKFYQIHIDTVYCVVRDGEMRMINGFVFIKPFYGEGLTEVDVDGKSVWAEFLGDTDIISGVKQTPKALEGILCHIGNPLGFDSRETLKDGDRVIFTPSFVFTEDQHKDKIEGEEYFAVQQWDIMAKVEDDQVIPVGDYVSVNPKGTILTKNRKLYDPSMSSQDFEEGQIFLVEKTVNEEEVDQGEVLAVGELCQDLQQGDKARFKAGKYLEDYRVMLLRECMVWGVEVND